MNEHLVLTIYKYVLVSRDVSAGATGATAVAPKFSDTLTLSQPRGADSAHHHRGRSQHFSVVTSLICTFIQKVSYCCCFVMSVLFETWGSFWKVAKSNEIFPYLNAFLIQRLLWSIAIPAKLRIISDRSRYHAAFPESKNGGGWYFIKKCHRQGGRSSYGYVRSRANI